MDVVVLVKDVPNPTGVPPEIGPDGLLRREEPDGGIDPADEPGLGVATRLVEEQGGTVTAVSMGPERSVRSCRWALEVGADRALLVSDDSLRGADALVTARALASAIRTLPFDLVVAGVESADGATGAVPAALAELLELPAVTFARRVEVADRQVTAERQAATGTDVVACDLPALVTLTAAAGEARYPSVPERMAARRKPIDIVSLADLGLGPDDVRPTQRVNAVEIAPQRKAGEVIDEADGPDRIVQLLERLEVLD